MRSVTQTKLSNIAFNGRSESSFNNVIINNIYVTSRILIDNTYNTMKNKKRKKFITITCKKRCVISYKVQRKVKYSFKMQTFRGILVLLLSMIPESFDSLHFGK